MKMEQLRKLIDYWKNLAEKKSITESQNGVEIIQKKFILK
jgi:hypothetical protein